jgi:DNA-binding NarL/FixJ family response regulator
LVNQEQTFDMEENVRCVIADDHPAIVETVRRHLESQPDIDVVGCAFDGEHALRLIEEHRPDVALLDVQMPRLSGIDIARRLHSAGSPTGVILYTGYQEGALLLEALDAGARGFLVKAGPLSDLSRALRVVAEGGSFVDPALAGYVTGPQVADRLPSLTKREREILRLLADGMRNEQVAAELTISPLTVQTHVKHAMDKLEADTRTHAVARALRESLIS